MKAFKLASMAAALLLAGVAEAQVIRIKVPDNVPLPVSTVTRAEVVADFHVWRLAGLQDFYRGDAPPDTESVRYREAIAKYEFMLASPEFPMLVAEIAGHPFALVLAGK
jgi:hypothetical protein